MTVLDLEGHCAGCGDCTTRTLYHRSYPASSITIPSLCVEGKRILQAVWEALHSAEITKEHP